MPSVSSASCKPAWAQLPAQAPPSGAAPAVPTWDQPTSACEAERDGRAEDGRTEQLAETMFQEYAAVLQGEGPLCCVETATQHPWLCQNALHMTNCVLHLLADCVALQARVTKRALGTRWCACGSTWRMQRRALQPAWCACAPD